jgi:hypothetical protein
MAFLAALLFIAQTSIRAASLNGSVRDEQNAGIADARITLTDKSKELVFQSESDAGGSFLFPTVEPGLYSVRITKQGFSTYEIDPLRIEVGERAALDVTLRIGEIRTAVEVSSADRSTLDAESNAIGMVVDSGRVRDLPLNGRNFLQLALLTGGAVDISPSNNNFGANVGNPGRVIVLPGSLPYSVNYALNGIPIRGSRDGEMASNVSVAAIDQFKVQESFLMPDQGAYGSAVNIITKSGSNRFNGELFEYMRNGSLDARSFFTTHAEDLKRNQFGFAMGGPLWKNRLWFHGFYEGLREISAFSTAGYSPTQPMFGGDFAGTGRPIYDPESYDPRSETRQPFANNIIPSARINPVARNLLPYYLPGSSLSSLPSNIYGSPRDTLSDDQGGLRFDAAAKERHQLFAQLFRQNSPAANAALFPFSGLLYNNAADLVMLAHTWTLSPRMVNSVRVAFVRGIATGGNEAQNEGPILKSAGIQNTVDDRGISGINLQGYSSFGKSNGNVGNSDNTWRVAEGFSYARSKHSFKIGADFGYRRGWHLNANSLALGQLQFAPAFTAQLIRNAQGQVVPQANTGDSFADFLLGIPTQGQVEGLPVVEYRAIQLSPYVQDTWRVTPNLTLNYGLSWYLDTPPDPQGWARGIVHGFDRVSGLLTYAALGQLDPKAVSTDRNNFAPRFGVAWKPNFLKNAVLRAGGGIYYNQFPWLVAQLSLIESPPFAGGQSFTNPETAPTPTYVLGRNIFPPKISAPLTPDYAANLPAGTLASALDPDLRTGYVGQWNVSIQKGLGKNDTVELSYLGSSAHHLLYYTDLSQCRPTSDLFCSPAAKPWPRYDLMVWFDSGGNASYDGLIARYEHRIERGLNLRFEYTLAKALTDAWQSSQTPGNQIAHCRACDKGPATFDVRHRAVTSAVWDLPFGRGRSFGRNVSRLMDVVAGGWTLTGIITFATGQPVYLTAPNQTGGLLNTTLPNRACDGRSERLADNIRTNGFIWFDAACFTVPDVGYFGNSGRTVLNAPGINNWDIGLEKSFPLWRDTMRLQFRAEMFNAWNHAQFQAPEGNAGAANFGRISASRPPRLIQLAMKMYW